MDTKISKEVTPACRCGCHRYGTTTACADCPDRHAPSLDLAERLEKQGDAISRRRLGHDLSMLIRPFLKDAFIAADLLRDQSATIEAQARVVEAAREYRKNGRIPEFDDQYDDLMTALAAHDSAQPEETPDPEVSTK